MPTLHHIPSIGQVHAFTERLYHSLLPVVADNSQAMMWYDVQRRELQPELQRFIGQVLHADEIAIDHAQSLFDQLPHLCTHLRQDAEMILQFDPAAYALEEVIVTYPGFLAITVYRFAHHLALCQIPILPRMMAEWAHSRTGIDIHPGATIGHPFFIDHGTGVVIGETTSIGQHVKLYQGVTLGALSVRKQDASTKRHPTIQDRVVIYANSTILGGNTVIGHDSLIGGNTFITESIDPHSVVYLQQTQTVADRRSMDAVLNWVI
jgi:serine O-acetyltransferase